MAKDPFKYFRVEARELLEQFGQGVLELEKGASASAVVPRVLRLAHTLKGAARVVRQPGIADTAHRIEDALAPWRDANATVPRACIETVLAGLAEIAAYVADLPVAADVQASLATGAQLEEGPLSLRADVAEMDALLVGVAQTHAQVTLLRRSCANAAAARTLALRLQVLLAPRRGLEGGSAATQAARSLSEELQFAVHRIEQDLSVSTERVERELRQLRDTAEQLRLIPVATLFGVLERSARDVARTLGKGVVFEGRGGEVRLDASVLGVVQGALLQLVRNAVAHGIEMPDARQAAGKPRDGLVAVEVLRRGRQVVFRCIDDGAGIDLEAVRHAARRKGLLDAAAPASDTAALMRLLLRGGLSTSSTVTEVSGRGVGLDVARDGAERLGGELSASTVAGQGTTLELVAPLSVASLDALLVEAAGSMAAVPLDALRCALRLGANDIARSAQGDTLVHEGQAIPYVALSRLLDGAAAASPQHSVSVLIVTHAGMLAAIGVDRLREMATIVLRPVPELAPPSPLVAGVALDIAGTPQLVLDAEGVVRAAQRAGAVGAQEHVVSKPVLVIDDSPTTRMLEQSILESAGYAVHAATSGEEGLERARREPYALFLVDVEMPGMDGFTFIERTRADPALRDIPAMLVTSRASPADRQRGLEVGAQAYIVKSEFAQDEFLARVRQLVEAR
jgi:two-component system chemotaxis sensor kinase CheA